MAIRTPWLLSFVLFAVACSADDAKPGSDGGSLENGTLAVPDDDGDGVGATEDCDDTDPEVNPDAVEVCDGVDNNCDGLIDDADPAVDRTDGSDFWPDADGDGFGDAASPAVRACTLPTDTGTAMVEDSSDCNDADAAISPAAIEVCDDAGVDENCNGVANDDDETTNLVTGTVYYPDADEDGHGLAGSGGLAACTNPSTPGSAYAETATDCDDTNPAVNPSMTEVCDPDDLDEDCSGAADDADAGVDPASQSAWMPDGDGDGYGDLLASPLLLCEDPSTTELVYVVDGTDCDDANPLVNPGMPEVCDPDDVDEDCNGLADDEDAGVDPTTRTSFYEDADEDGYGSMTATAVAACDDPSSVSAYVVDGTDCDDTESSVYPGAVELCNGEDDNCDGSADDSGLATFWDSSGTPSDYSGTLAGTAGSPAAVRLTDDGALGICAGTWYTHLVVDADVAIYGQTGVSGDVVLDGGLADAVVSSTSDGLDYSLSSLTLQNGLGSSRLFGVGFESGGGLACYSGANTTTVAMDNVAVVDNVSVYLGGGFFTYDCDLTLTDVDLSGNESAYGGGGFFGGGLLSIEDSAFQDNYATNDVGGLYLYDYSSTGINMDMVDSTMSDNASDFTCSTLALEGATTATIEGSSSGAASITDNVSGGSVGGAVYMSGASTLTFDNVDLGSTSGGDDNDPYDIFLLDSTYRYRYDDGVSVSCTTSRCGTAYADLIGGITATAATDLSTRGNVFLADKHGTIESIEFYLSANNGQLCDVDFYVLSAGSLADTTWSVEAANTTSVTSSTMSWVDSGTLGVSVEPGQYYALVMAYDCAAADDDLQYGYSFPGATTDDMGMGTSVGRWFANSEVYTSTWSSTAPSYFSASSTRYYSQVNWSH